MNERRNRLDKATRMNSFLFMGMLVCVLAIILVMLLGIVPPTRVNLLILASAGGGLSIFALVLLIRDTAVIREAILQQDMLEQAMTELGQLNRTLRAQRHDFLNHLQVVYALMETENYQEANDYIEKVYGEIGAVSRALKTAQPAVNAVLQAKMAMCDQLGIAVTLEISDDLSRLPMPVWELCRVLGNLIDNAMDALQATAERRLTLRFTGDVRGITIRVANNGPAIPADMQRRIFSEGISTKGENRGMGLSIVKEILEEAHGSIEVDSDAAETAFTVWIPHTAAEEKRLQVSVS